MEGEFTMCVEEGLKLAKRVYAGKERYTTEQPRQPAGMERTKNSLLPKAPMMYAVIVDPAIVDNPDIPSYQPHVYGRCDPPALIPLQMKEISVNADCYFDTAFIRVRGRWRVHCVMGSRSCDCRFFVPLGEQGSILGVEVNSSQRLCTKVVHRKDGEDKVTLLDNEQFGFLNHHFFSLNIPQVDGGCDVSVEVRWSQKLLYKDSLFSINIPFTFPEYVAPFTKIVAKHETIQLNVDTGTEKEVVIQKSTHDLKEKSRHVGRFSLLYEADVENWSIRDFEFSYSVFSSDPYGALHLNSPSELDPDQRNMFCLYLYPGSKQMRNVFKKEVVFLVDISGSMQGKPLESVKAALLSTLQELVSTDYFNIIAFNEVMYSFSSSLEPAHADMIANAIEWISKNLMACGGTDILQPLNQSLCLLSNTEDSIPYIFLVTDGSVENERIVCHTAKSHAEKRGCMSPRICTFGIGSFCNHYFLQMLSSIGRGKYSAAYEQDSIEFEMQKWFRKALFPVFTDITVDAFDKLEAVEIYPTKLPDLLIDCPLIISGRYEGKFPSTVRAEGRSEDTKEVVYLKVKNSVDIPIKKVVAKQHIDLLTAQAWFFESKRLEDKAAKLSIQHGVPSEYTSMILLTEAVQKGGGKLKHGDKRRSGAKAEAATRIHDASPGFGSVIATVENRPPCIDVRKRPDTFAVFEKAVDRCSGLCDCCCCMCFIRTCSKLNDQCVIGFTQLCTGLACFGCAECCIRLCCDGD